MSYLLSDYILVLGGVFLLWLGVALYVVMTRAVYDVREGAYSIARRLLEQRVRGVGEATTREELQRALARLSRRAERRVAADAATPEPVAAVFALRVLERSWETVVVQASSHGSEAAKWRRIAALRILARGRWWAAWPLLERALADRDEDVVAAAVGILGRTRTDAAAALLVDALRRGTYARSRIASQLEQLGERVPPLLLPLLRDPDAQVRYWAVTLLGRLLEPGDPFVLEIAVVGGDEDPAVRGATVEALARLQAAPAAAAARALLEDPVWYVRAHAARALRTVGDDADRAAVAQLLSDGSWWVRSAAKETLTAAGPDAVDAVASFLDSDDAFARNGAAEVLQNGGFLDRLVAEYAADPQNEVAARRLLRILDAGGPAIVSACAARATPEAADGIRSLAARLGMTA